MPVPTALRLPDPLELTTAAAVDWPVWAMVATPALANTAATMVAPTNAAAPVPALVSAPETSGAAGGVARTLLRRVERSWKKDIYITTITGRVLGRRWPDADG
jgi:hypothetical protein